MTNHTPLPLTLDQEFPGSNPGRATKYNKGLLVFLTQKLCLLKALCANMCQIPLDKALVDPTPTGVFLLPYSPLHLKCSRPPARCCIMLGNGYALVPQELLHVPDVCA